LTWLTGGAFLPMDQFAWRGQILADDYMMAVLLLVLSLLLIAMVLFRRRGASGASGVSGVSGCMVILVFVNLFMVSRTIHSFGDRY